MSPRMKKHAHIREIVLRKSALIAGTARPGRVTQLVPDGSAGLMRRAILPEAYRKAQAARARST